LVKCFSPSRFDLMTFLNPFLHIFKPAHFLRPPSTWSSSIIPFNCTHISNLTLRTVLSATSLPSSFLSPHSAQSKYDHASIYSRCSCLALSQIWCKQHRIHRLGLEYHLVCETS
jgi:hypothetical protein